MASYHAHFEISLSDNSRQKLSQVAIVRVLKDTTNLTKELITEFSNRLFDGKSVRLQPKGKLDVKSAFGLDRDLQQKGLQVNLWFEATGFDLPYLVNKKGIVKGTDNKSTKSLTNPSMVEAILHDAQIVQIGAFLPVTWISENEKWAYWKKIKPRYERDGKTPNPGYFGQEWLTNEGKRYILIWYAH